MGARYWGFISSAWEAMGREACGTDTLNTTNGIVLCSTALYSIGCP
jgi:hypothetical protein